MNHEAFKAARDARYEEAGAFHLENYEREPGWLFLSSSVGLTKEQWKALDPADRADLEEFYINASADVIQHRRSLEDNMKLAEGLQPIEEYVKKLREGYRDTWDQRANEIHRIEDEAERNKAQEALAIDMLRYALKLYEPTTDFSVKSQVTNAILETTKNFFSLYFSHEDLDTLNRSDLGDELYRRMIREVYSSLRLHGYQHAPYHDWLHYAERIAATGSLETPSFIERPPLDAYMDADVMYEELFPVLFTAAVKPADLGNGVNIAMGLIDPVHRASAIDNLEATITNTEEEYPGQFDNLRKRVELLKQPIPDLIDDRLLMTEQFLQLVLESQTASLTENRDEAVVSIRENIANLASGKAKRPPHYEAAARIVLSGEHMNDPFIFAKMLLEIIRSEKSKA